MYIILGHSKYINYTLLAFFGKWVIVNLLVSVEFNALIVIIFSFNTFLFNALILLFIDCFWKYVIIAEPNGIPF